MYKTKLVLDIKREQEDAEEQKQLKEKYDIRNPDVVVVEKSNMVKFTVRTFSAVLRTASTIILLVLAAVGLFTLIYPDIRAAFLNEIGNIYGQLKMALPFL